MLSFLCKQPVIWILYFFSISSSLALSPGWDQCTVKLFIVHCIVTFYSHRASLHSGIQISTGRFNIGGNPAMHPIQMVIEILLVTSCHRNRDKRQTDGPLGSYADFTSTSELLFASFFRLSAHPKHFTWKWLDFHENEWTGDVHLVL